MLEYIEKLKHNEFDTKLDGPHIAATALKQWLRSLDPLLIPIEFYDEFISQGQSASGTELAKMLKKIPEDHLCLLHALVEIVQETSSPQNFRETKMNIPILAVVFSPSIINYTGDSLREVMARSAEESKLTANLFSKLEVDKSLIEVDIEDIILTESKISTEFDL